MILRDQHFSSSLWHELTQGSAAPLFLMLLLLMCGATMINWQFYYLLYYIWNK